MRRVFVLWCVVHVCVCSRMLAVFPVPGRSHSALGDAAVGALLQAGHEVTYVSTHTTLEPHPALTHVDISSVQHETTERESLSLVELVRSPQPPHRVLEVGAQWAARALRHPAVTRLLHDPERAFDVVVAEWFYSGLLAPLAAVYSCPLVWYSSVSASWPTLQLVHGHTNPAHTADPQARLLPASYSMRDRLERLRDQHYLTGWMYYMLYYVENSEYQAIYRAPLQARARVLPTYEELVYNASLLLLNSQPVLGQVVPLPASAKYVGGHHIELPTKPLPTDLQQLLDSSTKGVIYFSLGSNVNSKDLPEYMKMQLIDILGRLEQTVIWKFEEELEDLPHNVHVVQWAPQTSILNHTNTILFISHGGFLSYMEAMYFGVPIIGIPIFGEQFLNMELAHARGHGRRVRFSEYLPYSLRDAIIKVLRNNSYQSNVNKASAILQHPLVAPAAELVHWVEQVVQHGGTHLRSPALRLSAVERLYLDLVAVCGLLLWFLSKVWKVIKVHWNSDTDTDRKNQ